MQEGLTCPHCGRLVHSYRNPIPTVDIIIELEDKGIILIKRAKEPFGWAIPGGFVDYGESLEDAARREMREERDPGVDGVQQPERRHVGLGEIREVSALGSLIVRLVA